MIGSRIGFGWRALALASFVAGCTAIFLVLYNVAGGIDFGKRYRFTAVVPTALQLSQNADVKQAGVTIGKVAKISNRGSTAVLELAIDPDRGPVHRDATVQVRAKTLVGENYVSLEPGTRGSAPLPDGGHLPIAAAKPAVQLDDILSTISPRRRVRLKRLLGGLGRGLGESRTVGATIGGLSDALIGGSKISDALVVQRQALANLVVDLGTVFRAVSQRRQDIQRLVSGAQEAATAVAAENEALRAGLRQLPPTLSRTRRTTTHLAAVGDHAAPVLDDLTASLELLTPVARELPAAAGPTLGALRRLAGASPAARQLLRSLRRVAGPASAMIGPLDDNLAELRPALDTIAPYGKDIASFFAATGAAVTARDATGHLARLRPFFSSTSLLTMGEAERKAIQQLAGLGAAKIASFKGANAYPKPGTLATPQPSTGYRRILSDNHR